MLATYTRRMELPSRTFVLLGPRGTGKTTWLRQKLSDARWFDLVRDRELVRLTRDPDAFRKIAEAKLRHGDVVRVGSVEIRFIDPNETDAPKRQTPDFGAIAEMARRKAYDQKTIDVDLAEVVASSVQTGYERRLRDVGRRQLVGVAQQHARHVQGDVAVAHHHGDRMG